MLNPFLIFDWWLGAIIETSLVTAAKTTSSVLKANMPKDMPRAIPEEKS